MALHLNSKIFKPAGQNGSAILFVLMLGILIMGVLNLVSKRMTLKKAEAISMANRSAVQNMQNSTDQSIDCDNTLSGIDVATECTSELNGTMSGRWFLLRDQNNRPISGSPQVWSSGAYAGRPYAKSGDLNIVATCSQDAQSIIVRFAYDQGVRKHKNALTKEEYIFPANFDYSGRKNRGLIFGNPKSRLCRNQVMGGAVATETLPQCRGDQYMVGIEPRTKTPICKDYPQLNCNDGAHSELATHGMLKGIYLDGANNLTASCDEQEFAGSFVTDDSGFVPGNCVFSNYLTGSCSCPGSYAAVPIGAYWGKCINHRFNMPVCINNFNIMGTNARIGGFDTGIPTTYVLKELRKFSCLYFKPDNATPFWLADNQVVSTRAYHCVKPRGP